MSRVRNGAGGVAALCCATVGSFEGYRNTAYPDPATHGPPWTACYGETKGIHFGDTFTKQQCDEKLLARLNEFGEHIEACVPGLKVAPRKVYVASLSLSYNIGWHAFCGSSIAHLTNAGETVEACDAFAKYDKAHGVTFPGLTRRREKERVMCLEGFMEGRLLEAWRA